MTEGRDHTDEVASEAGYIDCVKVLLDKGAEANMQSVLSLYDVYIQCSIYPESPVVNEDMCTGTLLCAYMYMPSCFITESSTSLDEAKCKENVMIQSFTNDIRKDKCDL